MGSEMCIRDRSADCVAALVQQISAVVPQQLACGLSPQHALAAGCVLSCPANATSSAAWLIDGEPMMVISLLININIVCKKRTCYMGVRKRTMATALAGHALRNSTDRCTAGATSARAMGWNPKRGKKSAAVSVNR